MTVSEPSPGTRFSTVRDAEGYDIAEVDAFLGRVETALASAPASVTARDIERAHFTPARLRLAYDISEVDGFVERLVADVYKREASTAPHASRGHSDTEVAGLQERVPSQPLWVRVVAGLAIVTLLVFVVAQVL